MTGTAVWYHAGRPPVPLRWVLIRAPAGTFTTQARRGTEAAVLPQQIPAGFVQRWQVEVTFTAVRRHLGVETQRQWSDLAIGRTTPALLGRFSLGTLRAHPHLTAERCLRQAAWYPQRLPTFTAALAVVRRQLWQHARFHTSAPATDMRESPPPAIQRLLEALCYAA